MKLDLTPLYLFFPAFVPLLVLVLVLTFDRRRRERVEKPPQQEKLLRPPGHSLALRLDELQEAILNSIFWACSLCMIAGGLAAVNAQFLAARVLAVWSIGSAVLFIAFALAGALSALRVWAQIRETRDTRLGLRGEQAVAESLHAIADCGYRFFHDLEGRKIHDRPGAKSWNIDHVAVGPRGVFLIETKARRRRPSRDGQPKHVVIYDGRVLQFPSWVDPKAIPQAEDNARDLAEFLSKQTAETVTVQPLVVLPGWYVEAKGNFPVKVMNANYLASYLRGHGEKVEPTQVRRIAAALDEKCRDLEF